MVPQWVSTRLLNSRGCLLAVRRDFLVHLEIEIDTDQGGPLRVGEISYAQGRGSGSSRKKLADFIYEKSVH